MSSFTPAQMVYEKKRKTLAVDFDNTLAHVVHFPDKSSCTWMNRIVHWYVRRKKGQGWTIILNTLREPHKGLSFALDFCKEYDIPIDYVNENIPEEIALWGDSRKISAKRSIDDTNIGLIGFLLRRFG